MSSRRLNLAPLDRRRSAEERWGALPARAAQEAPPERSGAPERVRLVPAHLPKPIRQSRRRKEVIVRPAQAADAAACALADARYTTTHVWQLDTRQEGDELRISFRQVRLPRELPLETPHHPPAIRGNVLPRGLLWLVAEEVELPPEGERPPPPATGDPYRSSAGADGGPWSHTLRRTGSASSVQLSFPPPAQGAAARASRPLPGGAETPALPDIPLDARPPRAGMVVGYVAAAMVPGEANAFLRTLVVDRKHRRKGIASRLLVAAQRWAAAQGAADLLADVPARNYPALRLLQKAGFTFCGFNDRCYPGNEVALFLSCRLR